MGGFTAHDLEKINKAEKKLVQLSDEEISEKLASSPLFEHINNEKMSPSFLKLAKISDSEAKLSDICHEGTEFTCDSDRNNYIYEYYKLLYSKNTEPLDMGGCIEEFLGPEILNSNIVKDAKVTVTERENLEGDITLLELDKSILE